MPPTQILQAYHVAFIDTLKYFQQSLGALATTMTDEEKQALKKSVKSLF